MIILSKTPLWVWPLFIGLFVLGILASRERRVPLWAYYANIALLIIPIRRVIVYAEDVGTFWVLFLLSILAVLLGAFWGYHLQPRWIAARSARYAHLKGERFTMAMVMAIFWLNFAFGVFAGVAPDLAQSFWVKLASTSILSGLSATFLGRSIRVARMPVTQAA